MIIVKTKNGDRFINDKAVTMVEHIRDKAVVNAHGAHGDRDVFFHIEEVEGIIYTNDAYETGDAIKAGYDVCPEHPFGDVNVTNGAHVIIDAEGDVTLDNRVCVELGSSLEVR